MKAVLSVLCLGLASVVSAAPAQNPVCIIGAGPGGLTAAAELQAKGKPYIIFEKQAAVGGKSQAFYE